MTGRIGATMALECLVNESELTVTVMDDLTVLATRSDGAQAQPDRFELDRLHGQLVRMFEDWLTESQRTWRRRELEVFGSFLYRALFPAAIDQFFHQSLASIGQGERVRVQLSFLGRAGEFARIPWEYLYFPATAVRKGFFFATHPKVVLSRYIPLEAGRPTLKPAEAYLRILVVVSQPTDLGKVLSDEVIAELERLAQVLPLQLSRLDQPTPDTLLSTLGESHPHVIHYVGHGQYNEGEGQGELALVDDDGTAMWYTDAMLAELLDHAGVLPHLVVLHSCEGAVTDVRDSFAGLAPQLIRAGVPAVVAMQYAVTNRSAIDFSSAFYEHVGSGMPIDHAVQEARFRLTQRADPAGQTRLLGVPVIYLQSRDGIIQSAGSPPSNESGTS
jgi:hypothetical protein